MSAPADRPMSPAMVSALQAVARMKGDAAPDARLWAEFVETVERRAGAEAEPEERTKPAEG